MAETTKCILNVVHNQSSVIHTNMNHLKGQSGWIHERNWSKTWVILTFPDVVWHLNPISVEFWLLYKHVNVVCIIFVYIYIYIYHMDVFFQIYPFISIYYKYVYSYVFHLYIKDIYIYMHASDDLFCCNPSLHWFTNMPLFCLSRKKRKFERVASH